METKMNFEELSKNELMEFNGGHHGFAYHLGEFVGGVMGVFERVVNIVGPLKDLKNG